MISFDTEDDSCGNCFLCIFYNGKKYTIFEKKYYKSQNKFREKIIDFIYNNNKEKFFAHNLEYDLSHIFQGVYLTLIDWYYSDKLLFAILKNNKREKTLFLDSFSFSLSSLAVIAKQMNMKKFDVNIKKLEEEYIKNPEKIINYCKNDCLIVYNYMSQFENFIKESFNLPLKYTIAGTAQNIYLKKFSNLKFDIQGKNINKELLNAYYGGRVECFHIGIVNRPVFELDVNSMYPFVMSNFKYPVKDNYISVNPVEKMYVSQIKVKIKKCDIPVLAYREKKLLFPIGEFTTWSTNIEIEKAIKEKQIIDIEYIKTYNFYETDFIFKEFVNYFYDLREQAKKDKNIFLNKLYKRILNSVYGRFALHKELKILTSITDKNESYIEKINNIAGYVPLVINSVKNKNFSIPIFVTSYARVILFDLIKKIKNLKFDILYCDTDSCHFSRFEYNPLFNDIYLLLKNFNIDNKIGNYSLKVYKSGIYQNCKAYLLHSYLECDVIKLKGIKEENKKEFFIKGKTQFKKPVKMRSSLRSIKGLKVNSWEDNPVERRGIFDKRKLLKLNDDLFFTEPLKMPGDKGD